MSNYDWQPKLPMYVWAILAIAILWLIIAFFFLGKSDTETASAYDRAVAAKLEAMRHPMKWSQPEEYTIWEKL